jgi:hypothetical protein
MIMEHQGYGRSWRISVVAPEPMDAEAASHRDDLKRYPSPEHRTAVRRHTGRAVRELEDIINSVQHLPKGWRTQGRP